MAIEPNRLVVQPVTERTDDYNTCVAITGTVPPEPRISVGEEGTVEIVTQYPEREGQMLAYSGANGDHRLYVVVRVGSDLLWKRVSMTTSYKDTTTGKDWSSL